MNKLKDDIHDCGKCSIFPCSTQEEVLRNDICIDCPVKCCHAPLLPMVKCEKKILGGGKFGGIKLKDNGWCHYYNEITGKCTIYEKRPIGCRIASCGFIRRGEVPGHIRSMKNRYMKTE